MYDKKHAVVAVWIACLMLCTVAGVFINQTVKADTGNVYVKWYVPYVTTIAIAYPTGIYEVRFNLSSGSCTNLAASYQNSTVAAFNVTNQGNSLINLTARFTSDMPSGVTHFYINTTNDLNTSCYGANKTIDWGDANDTVNQTILVGLGSGDAQGFWCWTTGSGIPANPWATGYNRTFKIYSTSYFTGS